MYICLCCGFSFRTAQRFLESRGECFGAQARELTLGCPLCGGAFFADPERRPAL